jgi:uncharacterized damage-inducible protein DinB
MPASIASLFPDWPQYNGRIRDAVVHLRAEQLGLRAGPGHAPIWALAAHVAGTRTYWLCGVFGQPGAEKTPFTEPTTGWGWEDDEDHPRTGEELAWALDSTFDVVRDCLDRWTVDDLTLSATRSYGGVTTVHSRASVLNRMFSHDAFHAGEISQLLGVHDLEAIDLWRRASPVTVP